MASHQMRARMQSLESSFPSLQFTERRGPQFATLRQMQNAGSAWRGSRPRSAEPCEGSLDARHRFRTMGIRSVCAHLVHWFFVRDSSDHVLRILCDLSGSVRRRCLLLGVASRGRLRARRCSPSIRSSCWHSQRTSSSPWPPAFSVDAAVHSRWLSVVAIVDVPRRTRRPVRARDRNCAPAARTRRARIPVIALPVSARGIRRDGSSASSSRGRVRGAGTDQS